MEQQAFSILNSGNPLAIVALIAIIAMYLVINYQRKNTAAERDAIAKQTESDINDLYDEIATLKEYNNKFEIEKKLLQKDVDFLKQENTGIKEDIKEIKNTLNNMAIALERIASKYDTKDNK